ncbi:hypothetical protein LWI28_005909 [Acer negundo]|uniref:BAH domain-containing protein n=1 Tax=Acer negundo TaxID=4023 RepID=A0AAD5NQT3_ACENE|nr:hypothetical protein LWI28_005909 [Acer negundo]
MPRRAVALLDSKDKSIHLSEKVSVVEKLLLKLVSQSICLRRDENITLLGVKLTRIFHKHQHSVMNTDLKFFEGEQLSQSGSSDVELKKRCIRNWPVSKEQGSAKSTKIKVQRIFSREDISAEKAYCSDIREVYYGEQVLTVPIIGIEGKCDIRKKHDLPSMESRVTFEHIFFCEHLYGPDKGAVKQVVYVFFIVL